MLFQLLVILCLYKYQLKGSWACILEGNAILGRAALPPYWQKCFKILWIREASYTFKLCGFLLDIYMMNFMSGMVAGHKIRGTMHCNRSQKLSELFP